MHFGPSIDVKDFTLDKDDVNGNLVHIKSYICN